MSTRAQPPYLAVVQRGNTRVYEFLREHFEGRGLVEVVWERRERNRRTARRAIVPDRRQTQRRRRLPDTWASLGFLLIRRGGNAPTVTPVRE